FGFKNAYLKRSKLSEKYLRKTTEGNAGRCFTDTLRPVCLRRHGKVTMSKSVAVVGAGLVGRGWAIVFARAGHPVRLFDVTEEKIADALKAIENNLADLASHALIANPDEIRARITGT